MLHLNVNFKLLRELLNLCAPSFVFYTVNFSKINGDVSVICGLIVNTRRKYVFHNRGVDFWIRGTHKIHEI